MLVRGEAAFHLRVASFYILTRYPSLAGTRIDLQAIGSSITTLMSGTCSSHPDAAGMPLVCARYILSCRHKLTDTYYNTPLLGQNSCPYWETSLRRRSSDNYRKSIDVSGAISMKSQVERTLREHSRNICISVVQRVPVDCSSVIWVEIHSH